MVRVPITTKLTIMVGDRSERTVSTLTRKTCLNGEDYNIYPLTQSTNIKKIKSTLIEPMLDIVVLLMQQTPISNITVLGDDGYLFSETYNNSTVAEVDYNTNYNAIVYTNVEKMIASEYMKLFYNSTFRTTLLSSSVDGRGGMGEDYLNIHYSAPFVWKCLPSKVESGIKLLRVYRCVRLSKYL